MPLSWIEPIGWLCLPFIIYGIVYCIIDDYRVKKALREEERRRIDEYNRNPGYNPQFARLTEEVWAKHQATLKAATTASVTNTDPPPPPPPPIKPTVKPPVKPPVQPPPIKPPVKPPTVPPPDTPGDGFVDSAHGITVKDLEKLRNNCLHEFRGKKFKIRPLVFIRETGHFQPRENRICLAHAEFQSELGIPCICFNAQHLDHPMEDITDTMMHELIHHWCHQHGYEDGHGPKFKQACDLLGVHYNPEWEKNDENAP